MDYQNAIGEITKLYREEMDKQLASIIKEKDDLRDENQELKDKILKLEDQNDKNSIELQK